MRRLLNYFTKFELMLWLGSVGLVVISYIAFSRPIDIAFFASLIGATALIFNAKGNPFGQMLMLVFCVIYGYISYTFAYYGEVLTYLGMSFPMAALALVSWLRHPYKGKKSQVEINTIGQKEIIFMIFLSLAVTVILYFLLEFFNTANIVPSTFSVTTSFIAAYLVFRRSPYFALAYAVNDVVLLVLWVLASLKDISYLSVVICFVMFLVNDLYGFFNWKRMQKRQQ